MWDRQNKNVNSITNHGWHSLSDLGVVIYRPTSLWYLLPLVTNTNSSTLVLSNTLSLSLQFKTKQTKMNWNEQSGIASYSTEKQHKYQKQLQPPTIALLLPLMFFIRLLSLCYFFSKHKEIISQSILHWPNWTDIKPKYKQSKDQILRSIYSLKFLLCVL